MVDGFRPRLPLGQYVNQLATLRSLIHEHHASALLVNGGLPCQLGVPAARTTGIPLLCQFHHPANRRYLHLWLVKYAQQLIFPSEYTRSIVQARLGKDGTVVYNGVDDAVFTPASERDLKYRAELDIPARAVVFGQIGALQPHKRQRLLLQAFAASRPRMPHAYVVLVGAGVDLGSLRQFAADLEISERVRFTGYVPSTVPYLRHVLDVNVLASAEEGLGISVLEGSAAALPAIVADATGLRETVTAGITGLTFPVDDATALSGCLERLYADTSLRETLGSAGRRLVQERFSSSRYRARIAELVANTIQAPISH